MKRIKLITEIFVTVLCLGMVYALAIKHGPDTGGDIDLQASLQAYNTAEQSEFSESASELDYINAYEAAADIDEKNTLRAMAKKEAQNMLATGDTSKYQKELEKNGIVMRAMGF